MQNPTEGAVPTGAAPSGMQRCTRCGQTKPLEDFALRTNRKNGRHSQCKACVNIWAAGYRERSRPRPRTETRQCETCGGDFEWSSMRPTQAFCSKKCYRPKGTRLQQLRRRVPEDSWVCSACFQTKPLTEFPGGRSGSRCKPCQSKYQREWRQRNIDKTRESQRRSHRNQYTLKKHGLTREEYERSRDEAMVNGCAICRQLPENGKSLHFDHCHTSGKHRGWLCENCNRGLGMFADDVERLLAAVAYLQDVA